MVEEPLREADHFWVRPQVIRRRAARDEEGIELLRAHLVDPGLGLGRDLALLPFQLFPRLEPDHGHAVAFLEEGIVRLLEFGVLEVTVEETRDPHCDTSLLTFPDIKASA